MKKMLQKALPLAMVVLVFASTASAQMKVGNNPSTITPSAVLDVESATKGVLLPRVALTSITDTITVASPAVGLLVYNKGTAALTFKGYVYWDGTSWRKLDGSAISTTDAISTSNSTVGPLTLDSAGTNYEKVITSPDGKFSVRVKTEVGFSFDQSDLQIRSNSGAPTIMWNGGYTYVNGAGAHGNNGMTFPAQGVWYGNGGGSGTVMGTGFGQAWGDPDVYYNAPEYRRYTWTTTNTLDKTMYVLYFMLGAPNAAQLANTTNCPSGTCSSSKAFLRIEQIQVP